MAAPRDKRSPTWHYFEVCEKDDSKTVCTVCKESVSSGGSKRKSYNTSNLRKHLEQHHAEKYKELVETEQREKSRKRMREADKGQPKIDETLEERNPYNPSSERYIAITKAIACMITSNFRPFYIVEDEGFRHLVQTLDRRYQLPSRKPFSEKVIPQMYAELREKVSAIVQTAVFNSDHGWLDIPCWWFLS